MNYRPKKRLISNIWNRMLLTLVSSASGPGWVWKWKIIKHLFLHFTSKIVRIKSFFMHYLPLYENSLPILTRSIYSIYQHIYPVRVNVNQKYLPLELYNSPLYLWFITGVNLNPEYILRITFVTKLTMELGYRGLHVYIGIYI